MTTSPCPCQSGLAYGNCCAPLHQGAAAATPEALMRSRYSAYVRNDSRYVMASWHESTRPSGMALEDGDQWLGLEIVDAGADGDTGWVSFRATRKQAKGFAVLSERSRFLREDGRWFYVDGDHQQTTLKPGRNDACPCGSGKKFKKCCGA